MQSAECESRESGRVEPRTAGRTGAPAVGRGVAERADSRVQRADRAVGAAKLSASGTAETGQRSGHADRAHLPADAGRSASFSQEPGTWAAIWGCNRDGETPARTSRRCTSARKAIPICELCWCRVRLTFWARLEPTVTCDGGA